MLTFIRRIRRSASFHFDAIDFFLLINDLEISHFRGRSQDALNRKKKKFETSTYRESSQFEKMKMKTNEKMNSIIEKIIQRADSAPDRRRRGGRTRSENRTRDRGRDRAGDRTEKRSRNETTNESTNEADEMNQIDQALDSVESDESDENEKVNTWPKAKNNLPWKNLMPSNQSAIHEVGSNVLRFIKLRFSADYFIKSIEISKIKNNVERLILIEKNELD